MPVKVILAEKPSVGRDIARVLGANRRGDGFIAGRGFVVTWALGHLVQFAEPNDYGSPWSGRWSFSQLPIIPENWELKSQERTKDQLKVVQRWFNDPETEEIICATDAGREGENIFRLIYRFTGCTKPFRRLWISSLTDEAIREGFANLQPGSDFDDLAAAALARTQADWLVGMNMTRAYTVHNNMLCTIGRVQTPTLAMIVKRDWEIRNFEKAYYYELAADFTEGFTAKYLNEDGKYRIDSKVVAQRLHQQLSVNETGTVLKVSKKKKRNRPPQLYDLITLQKEANKRFGFTAQQVLTYAQQLYEKFKLITYPRTESRHISEDMAPQLPRILANLEHPQAPLALERLRGGHKLGKHYMDKTKLSDHHGILPTGRRPPSNLSGPPALIYNMIVTRFVAIFLPDQVVEETTVTISIGDATFQAKGSVELERGWKIVEPPRRKKEPAPGEDGKATKKDDEKDFGRQALPPLQKDQVVHIDEMRLVERETAPPKPYTDATLLTAMKNAGREIEDDALAEAMKESGLGTPATRAEMIEKLIRTRVIERRKKALHPLPKGDALIGMVQEPLRSPELTGAWEQRLKDIENGKLGADQYYQSIVAFIKELLPQVRNSKALRGADFEPRPAKTAKAGSVGAATDGKKPASQGDGGAVADGALDPKPRGLDTLGTCPNCKRGWIIKGKSAYGCTRYRPGCRFLIPLAPASKKLTQKQVTELIEKGKTRVIKGFKREDGQTFNARLVLGADHALQFEPVEAKPKKDAPPDDLHDLTCPRCGQGRIIQGKRGFGCNRFKQGCRFVVWNEYAGKTLTPKQIRRLLEKGKTTLIKGFKGEDGSSYGARLVLDAQKEVQMARE
ncbi:DNA topoisomerase [Sulfidibacter corallicola]|uniref:DNA topoisomerase n=1 Tax=Sulfidibacter corallicola TaxID=2818388 RepID=A0A8A4TFV0_SULCO|nr:type IA DNA topoisomerase [Sulfidibacter corallicola]QTD48084.1 DNA topoisomerase 3 [Sulfidibacter corallicola]